MADKVVRIGSRDIDVDESPLPVKWGGYHFKFALQQSDDGPLKLLPGRGVRVFGWIICFIGWPIFILGLLSIPGLIKEPTLANAVAVLFLLGFGFLSAMFGVTLLGRRYRFDPGGGELTIRFFLRTRHRPITDILAVQVINAGLFGSKTSEGDSRFVSYQLNLVLDDLNEPRLFVAYNADLADMELKARRLADFLGVPLLTSRNVTNAAAGESDTTYVTGGPSDPTRYWAKSDAPLPAFDLATGALGGLCLGDRVERAEFLGRPEQVESTGALIYAGRGLRLEFEEGKFVSLLCHIAPRVETPPQPGEGHSRPRLSSGMELTPETSVAQVRQVFGPPKADLDYPLDKILTYDLGRFTMVFEFDPATEKLLDWEATLDN